MRIGIGGFGSGLGATGGVQVYRRELIAALAAHAKGHELVLVLGPDDEVDAPAGVEVVRLPWPEGHAPGRWKRRLRLARLLVPGARTRPDGFCGAIDRLGLDVIHYPATRFDELGLRTPVALTFFDMQEEFLPAFFPWRERAARRIAHRAAVRRADAVIAPSTFTADSLRRVYGVPAEKVTRVPVGIGPELQPEPLPGERTRVLARYGLPAGFLLYPANPWPHKNHALLFTALRRLNERGRALTVVCTGRLRNEPRRVADLAHEAGLSVDRDVHDLGFVPAEDMPALYRTARLVVFPSLFEGFGMPVLEALACGTPVACAGIPPLREIGGEACRYFTPTQVDEAVDAIAALLDDPGLASTLRTRGLERARSYRWEALTAALLDVYHRAASRRRR